MSRVRMRLLTWEGMPEHIEEMVLNAREYGIASETYWGNLYKIYFIDEWRAEAIQRAMDNWMVRGE